MSSLRALEQAHDAIAWCAAASLLAAVAGAIRKRARTPTGAHGLTASLGTVAVTAAAGLDLWLAPPFERGPRQLLFVRSESLGWLFERQQHLAFSAALLAWCGTAVLALRFVRARAAVPSGALDASLGAIVLRAYLAAFAFAAFAALASTLVARVVHF